jgi:hypothetical protein
MHFGPFMTQSGGWLRDFGATHAWSVEAGDEAQLDGISAHYEDDRNA